MLQKAKPTVNDVHVNRPLTNIATAYLQSETNFITNRVFPIVPVDNKSDVFFALDKDDFRRDNLVQRQPATESAGGGYRLSSNDTYNCLVYAWHIDIPNQLRAAADVPLNLDLNAIQFIMQTIMIGKERKWVADFFKTGVWDTDAVGATDFTQWDQADSDPEADVQAGKESVLQRTGNMPNTLVVDFKTHNALKRHPLIQERFKYTSNQSVTEEMIAKFFELDRYLVGKASYNSADEEATAVNAMILGDNALLLYVPESPGILVPTAGYTFVWRGLTGMSDLGVAVSSFNLDKEKALRVEGEFAYDQTAIGTDLGYFFSNTLA